MGRTPDSRIGPAPMQVCSPTRLETNAKPPRVPWLLPAGRGVFHL